MGKTLKRAAAWTALVFALGCIGLYLSMEDYQKENLSKLIDQTFSSFRQGS